MSDEPNMGKFETHVPKFLLERYAQWANDPEVPKISKRQLGSALFKLFLVMPDEIRLAALFGKAEVLQRMVRIFLKTPEEAYREGLGQIAQDLEVAPGETGHVRKAKSATSR